MERSLFGMKWTPYTTATAILLKCLSFHNYVSKIAVTSLSKVYERGELENMSKPHQKPVLLDVGIKSYIVQFMQVNHMLHYHLNTFRLRQIAHQFADGIF